MTRPSSTSLSPDQISVHRPLSVTMLALGVLSIAIFNLIGLSVVVASWDFLVSLLPFSPAWLGAVRLFWGTAGVVIAWGLWTGRSWAPRVTRVGAILYSFFLWIDRFVMIDPAVRSSNYTFLFLFTILILVFVYFALASPISVRYFGVTND